MTGLDLILEVFFNFFSSFLPSRTLAWNKVSGPNLLCSKLVIDGRVEDHFSRDAHQLSPGSPQKPRQHPPLLDGMAKA